jgi:hypothetical protein
MIENMKFYKNLTAWTLVALLFGLTQGAYAGTDWSQNKSSSSTAVDHTAWNVVLQNSITTDSTGLNLFDYDAAAATHKSAVAEYVKKLENTTVTALSKPEQKALWINLYNALTVKLIIDNLPVDSIKEIKPSLLSFGPWDKELTTVEGQALSLNDIEHEILRPLFGDNRIHYAVNCASIGCPNLQNKAYTADNTEALLDFSAKQYVNHPRGVTIEDEEDLILSSIYKWYSEDFGEDEEDLIDHLSKYAEPALKTQLELFDEVDDYQYNWDLNQS